MTKEEIKAMLERYKFENQFYKEKVKEFENLQDNANKTIQILKEIKQEQTNIKLDNIISSYAKDIVEAQDKLSTLKDRLKKTEKLLEWATQPNMIVLYYKYINGLSIEQIADVMNYSTQRIYQFHDNGINEIVEKEDA